MSSSKQKVNSFFLAFGLLMVVAENGCYCRYLPTRNYSDNIERLRELMYQILESSSENQQQQQTQPQLYSSPVTSFLAQTSLHDRGSQQVKSDYGVSDNFDTSSSNRGDRLLRNGGYDTNARLKLLLKHPHRLMNVDQLL